MLYVDTSVIVSALTNEADTALSQIWLAGQERSELTISDWTTREFASALSTKMRTGALGADHRAAALSAFTRLCAESFRTLPVESV
jgi:predicted nucleic acid-binding protein